MSLSFELSIDVSKKYDFKKEALLEIDQNRWVSNQWPLVYFIQNEDKKVAYVGESTNFSKRVRNHLSDKKKANAFNKISIIGSDKFNKSATLDIESKLIQYISAEETYELQNGNYGLTNHNYYQQDLYKNLFKEIWKRLLEKKVVSKSLQEIENSELFKYSPYKSLNANQYKSVLLIIEGLINNSSTRVFVSGCAGTGKTILATYLIKLLYSKAPESGLEDLSDQEVNEIHLLKAFKEKYPNPKIAIVVAMTSLRKTLRNVFEKTPGLKASMVISPSDTFKKKYDLLIVDEAHRLRQYKNISWMGAFKKNNQKLGLNDDGNELHWILANSKNQVFFYDPAQSVKPSDIEPIHFNKLLKDKDTLEIELTSQMRAQGGNDYITFVDTLLNLKRKTKQTFTHDRYELLIFDSLKDLYEELSAKEAKHGLCRLIAGYAWRWKSNPKIKPKPSKDTFDIEIDGLKFKWNSEQEDWVNSKNAFKEVGCIHTTQGYDLNYAGIIFGKEISYNKDTNEIEIDPKKYFDINGKKGIVNGRDLKSYIINIYKTIMFRGIKGTFVYACDKNLREYLKHHIQPYEKSASMRILPPEDVKPYVNAVPIVDITAAAGNFSNVQIHSEHDWVELPINITPKDGYFVCQVVGESMNKKIPNGSWCLFEKDRGGSRQGKIVLVEHYNIQDSEFGAGYTVKSYYSEKKTHEEGWYHEAITLKPLSNDTSYQNIELNNDDVAELKVVGIFKTVLKFNHE